MAGVPTATAAAAKSPVCGGVLIHFLLLGGLAMLSIFWQHAPKHTMHSLRSSLLVNYSVAAYDQHQYQQEGSTIVGDAPPELENIDLEFRGNNVSKEEHDAISAWAAVTGNTHDFPYRFAEGVGGVYHFAKRADTDSPAVIPYVARGAIPKDLLVPQVIVKRPPQKDASYVRLASQRPIIGGVYRSPYHPELCNELLDPCETIKDPTTLVLADSDANRPPINTIHCFREPPASAIGCGSPSNHGCTVMYRHRFPRRWHDKKLKDFAGVPYSDIGRPASFRDATKAPYADNSTWRYDPTYFSDCNASLGMQVLISRRLGNGYGLTNRLLAVSGTIALGARVGRHVGLDNGGGRIQLSNLINVSSSVWPERLRFVKRCNSMPSADVRYTVAGKGKHGYKQIDRRMVSRRPQIVLHRLDLGFYGLRHRPSVLFHDMYLRYPYEQDMDLRSNAGTVFCGMQFVSWIQDAAHQTIRRLRELAWQVSKKGTRKYAALHFRQESSDSIAMLRGRRAPSVKQAQQFLEDTIAPLLKQRGIEVLVVCSGSLDSAMWSGLKSKGQLLGIQVVSKTEMLPQAKFNDFGTSAYDREGSVRIKVTPTDGAAADALIMEKADLVLLTTTSSLSALVYAKRCGGSVLLGSSITWNRTRSELGLKNDDVSESFPGRVFDNVGSGCTLVGQVYLYDTYLDGTFTHAIEYPCGYQFGEYIVAPPALVPRPRAEVDVVTFRFKPDSTLYSNVSRNYGWTGRILLI